MANGGTPTSDPANWDGDVAWATPVDLAQVNGSVLTSTERTLTQQGLETGSRAIAPPALIVSTRAPIGYVAEARTRMAFNQGCRGLSPIHDADCRYFRYQLLSMADQLAAAGQGSTFVELTTEALASTQVIVPPVAAQRVIADFLDRETALIDAIIEKKRRMAVLLEERLRAKAEFAIQSSMTSAEQAPLRYLVTEIDQRLGERGAPALLSVSIHRGVVPRSEMTDKMPRAEELSHYKLCSAGDVVLNRMRAFQGGVGVAQQVGTVSPDYTVFRLGSRVEASYMHHLLRSPWFIGQMTTRLRGIGSSDQGNVRTPRINFADLGLIPVPVPPLDEQRRIGESLTRAAADMEELVARLVSQLDLIQEHRQGLVTAAVTGQLDVAEAV